MTDDFTRIAVRFPRAIFDAVRAHLLHDEREEICFLFANVVERSGLKLFLVRRWIRFPPDAYKARSRLKVAIDHRAKNALYSEFAASDCNGIINCHSHPFSGNGVTFSSVDDFDDEREFAWIYEQLPVGKANLGKDSTIHALSAVFGQRSIDIRGYDSDPQHRFLPVDLVQVVGAPYEVIIPTSAGTRADLSVGSLALFDRQVRAFGREGQRVLGAVRMALVGAGGVGSILAENVARLGVRYLVIVDPDRLEASNLNRWQGGRPEDIGAFKVEVLARHLTEMIPELKVIPVAADLFDATARAAITKCDWLVGAVDNHLARSHLNHLAVQYLMPYLDGSSQIDVENGRIAPKFRLGIVVPGYTACMACSQVSYYDSGDIAKYFYDDTTRAQLAAGGYIRELPDEPSPAVMPLNTLIAGTMAMEALNLATGFHPIGRYIRIDWLDINNKPHRLDDANFAEPPAPDCLVCQGYLAMGDAEPVPVPVRYAGKHRSNLPMASSLI